MRISWTRYVEPLARLGDPNGADAGWESPDGDPRHAELRTALLDGDDGAPVYRGPVLSTSVGLMGTTTRGLVARNCSLWVCLLDRDLTQAMVDAAAAVPGVELLSPLTRYRFLVGFNPLFETAACQAAVERALGASPTRLTVLTRAAAAVHPCFSVVAGPPLESGGPPAYEVVAADSRDELAARVAAATAPEAGGTAARLHHEVASSEA